MRFGEIREVKEAENFKDKEKEEGYKKIKPETNISVEEAKSYWENVFGSIFN